MSKNYQQRMIDHYVPLISKYGHGVESLDWGSQASQFKRFDVLLESVNMKGSVLDVGCGLGDLTQALEQKGFQGRYLGVDMVPEMTEQANLKYPDYCFEVQNFFEKKPVYKVDSVVSSGLFTFMDNGMMQQMIKIMYGCCCEVLVFNALSTRSSFPVAGEFYADAEKTKDFCLTLCDNVILNHDYFPHDFTVTMIKKKN